MKAPKKIQEKPDVTVKLVIIGDSGVGKTNVLLRFCDDEFKLNYVATIGVDFKVKTINVDGKKIKLQIWDTAGQDRFKNINQTYYKGAIGVVLVYSITDLNSFNNVKNWIKQIYEHTSPDIKKVLIGNKCDLESERKVSMDAGKKLAAEFGMHFLETSAKTGTNINEVFDRLGREIKEEVCEEKNDNRISLANKS